MKKEKILAFLAVFLIFALLLLLTWRAGVPLVQFASQPEKFRAWVEAQGIWGKLAFMGMVILQVIAALIPGEPFEIVAGYAFGAVEGTLLCLVASALGSTLVFWLVRRFGVRLVELFFPRDKLTSLRFLQSSPKRDRLFFLIFMLPGTPKDLLSYFAGLTDIRFPVWLMICSFGRLPSLVTSAVGGDALGTKQYGVAIVVFLITMLISGLGFLLYQYICKKKKPAQ